MKLKVDATKCEHHGQCTLSAPEVFELVGPHELRYDADPDDSVLEAVQDAVDACPMQAITLELGSGLAPNRLDSTADQGKTEP